MSGPLLRQKLLGCNFQCARPNVHYLALEVIGFCNAPVNQSAPGCQVVGCYERLALKRQLIQIPVKRIPEVCDVALRQLARQREGSFLVASKRQ